MTARPLQAGAAMTNVGPMDDHIIIERVAQPYAGITSFVAVGSLGTAADRIPEVFAWLGVRGVAPAGAPFFRYDVIDMERGFTVTVGVPVAAIGAEEPGEVAYGVLPAGRFASTIHVGPPDSLVGATRDLLDWADREGLRFTVEPGDGGEHWACRLESYLSDPTEVPDVNEWQTELAFLLAG